MQFTLCYVNELYASDLVGVVEQERMSKNSEERPGDTVRLLRPPPRVFTEPQGHNIWMGDIEVLDTELELVSAVNTDPYNSAGHGES